MPAPRARSDGGIYDLRFTTDAVWLVRGTKLNSDAAFQLENTMRADHFLFVGMVLCFQWLLMGTGGMITVASETIPFALIALVLPVPAYIWALRDASVGLKTSRRAVRITIVGLVAVGLSFVGFILGFAFIASRVRAK